jgi:single-strand DNA-binding protein
MLYNVNFIGRIGTDAETVSTGATPFISCRVAVDDNNGKEKSTRWVSLSLNADRYKNIAQYLTKGKLVFVSGSERVSAYTTKSGQVAVDTRIWADNIQFVPTGQKQESTGESTATEASTETKNQEMKATVTRKEDKLPEHDGAPEPIDDLPF